MSKMSLLQSQLEKATGKGRRSEEPSVAAPTPPVEAPKRASTIAPSRVGRVHIGGYLPSDFKRSLRLVQAQTGDDTQTLLAKALNELFRSHNVPVIEAD